MRARLSVAMMPLVGVLSVLVLAPAETSAQYAPGEQGSDNMEIVAHVPLAGALAVADIEIEQDLERPYAYVSRRLSPPGFQVIDLSVPEEAKLIYSWFIENAELHRGDALDGKYFKLDERYYYVQSMSFRQGGPDSDLGAVAGHQGECRQSWRCSLAHRSLPRRLKP